MGFISSLFGLDNSSKSESKTETKTETTDNRQVGGDGAIMIGAGGHYTGTDGGAVRVAEFNAGLMQAISEHQTDGAKAMFNMSTQMLDRLGESVTDVTLKSGANMAQAWTHTLDTSGAIIEQLTAGARANADAGQVVAMAALKANKNDGATASDMIKYAAIAAAVVGGLWAIGRKG